MHLQNASQTDNPNPSNYTAQKANAKRLIQTIKIQAVMILTMTENQFSLHQTKFSISQP